MIGMQNEKKKVRDKGNICACKGHRREVSGSGFVCREKKTYFKCMQRFLYIYIGIMLNIHIRIYNSGFP